MKHTFDSVLVQGTEYDNSTKLLILECFTHNGLGRRFLVAILFQPGYLCDDGDSLQSARHEVYDAPTRGFLALHLHILRTVRWRFLAFGDVLCNINVDSGM